VNDTSDEIRARYREMLLRLPGEERLAMACRMFDTARAIVRAGLGEPADTKDSPDTREAIFRRFYGRDFDETTAARIVARLRQSDGR
jgi:hypothetical protein